MKLRLTLFGFLMLFVVIASAKTYFTINKSICLPVIVKVNGGPTLRIEEYEISYGTNFQNLYKVEDCQGRRIGYTAKDHYSTGSEKDYYYSLDFVYSSSSSDNSSTSRSDSYSGTSDSYSGLSNSSSNSTAGEIGRAIGDFMIGVFKPDDIHSGDSDAYGNMQLRLGASRQWGEFADIKFCFGSAGGLSIFGGVGKEMLSDRQYKDKTLWHAGMGLYMMPREYNDVELAINFCYSPIHKETVLMDLTYTHFLGERQRFAVFGGASWGLGNADAGNGNETWEWDVRVGFSVRFFTI